MTWESRPIFGHSILLWWPMSRPAFDRSGDSWLLQLGPIGVRRFGRY